MAHLGRLGRGLVCLAIAGLSCIAEAQSSGVDRGVAWLSGQVQGSGTLASESSSTATPFQARAESLTTLRQLATAPSALADLVAQDSTLAVESLARKARALAPMGRDVSSTITQLLARQNADGGFGGAAGYQSNALDTAYALLALRASSSGATAAIASAIAYLKSQQAADGSFKLLDPASVFVTAYALEALAAYAATQSVASNIAAARAWLAAKQVSGSYGNTLDNATAVLALLASSTDTGPVSGPAGAIAAAQEDTTFSWKTDPYLTAIALRALAAARELMGPPTTGQVSGNVVEHTSGSALAGAEIKLSGPQAANALSDAQGLFVLGNLPPGTYTLQATKAGYATVSLTVTITAGITSRVGTLRLEVSSTTATVQGTVLDGTTGQVLAGATVQITPGSSAVTDAAGNYRISGLLPGSASFTVSKTGYESVTVSATLAANVVYSFSPSLYPPGQGPNAVSLKGKVIDRATSQPVAGAQVKVGAVSAATSATGDFLLEGLAAGSVTVEVSASGYRTSTLTGTITRGVNDVGSIALDKAAATANVSGRVTEAATNLPIGGASVSIQGTSFAATTNSNGNYAITGVDRTSFTVVASAAGYQTQNIPVSMPSFGDVTVDAALSKLATGSITLRRVATNLPSYGPHGAIEIEAEVNNSSGVPADVLVTGSIYDSAGTRVILTAQVPETIPGNAFREVELEAHNGALPAGPYRVVVQVTDAFAQLVAEGTTSFVINAKAQVAGDVALDPPMVQAGSGQAVRMTATMSNYGNVPVAAGQGELTVTLVTPEPGVGVAATAELLPGVIAGGLLNLPLGAGFDAQGNFYTLNKADRKVVRVSPDGTTLATVTTLPATLPAAGSLPARAFFPQDALAAPNGTVYVLNQTQDIVEVSPDGTFRRLATNISTSKVLIAFDRDSQGNFHVMANLGSQYTVELVPAGGGSSETLMSSGGLAGPMGLARGSDGNLYVTNSNDNTVSRIRSDGSIEAFVTGGLSTPKGIAAHPDGTLYVANSGANNIVTFRVDNRTVTPYVTVQGSPTDVKLDAAGNTLWVSVSGENSVQRITRTSPPTVEVYARSIVQSPQAMRYDAGGNLLSLGEIASTRKDAADVITPLYNGVVCGGRDVAIGPAAAVFLSASCGQAIYRVKGAEQKNWVSTGPATDPYGIAYDGASLLYVTESSGASNRIVSFDANADSSPAKATVAESLLRSPRAVRVDAAGNRFILNSDSITRLPADGSRGTFVVGTGTFSAGVSMALTADGGYLVQESNAVRKLVAGAWTRTGLNALANGVAEGTSGSALVGDTVQRKILRVSSSGVTDLTAAALVAAPATINALTSDAAAGVYVALSNGHIVRAESSGSVTQLTATPISPAPTRLAFDAVGRRLYFVNGAGMRWFHVDTKAVDAVPGLAMTFESLEVSASQVYATRLTQRELFSISPATGQATAVAAGFLNPKPIAWTGGQLVFSDSNHTFSLVPGRNPVVVAYEAFSHLAWHNGTLYGTRGDTRVYSLRPGTDSASQVVLTVPDTRATLQAIAVRGDGLMTVGSTYDSTVWSFAAGGANPVATYIGINNALAIAVAPSGDLYVASAGSQQVVLIPAGSRQSRTFANNISVSGLTHGSDGVLYGATFADVLRFAANGAPEKLNAPPGGLSFRGLVAEAGGVHVADLSANAVYRLAAGTLTPFAVGLKDVRRVRVDPAGGLLIASSGNGTIARLFDRKLSPHVTSLRQPTSLAYAANGELLVGGGMGDLFAVNAARQATLVANIAHIYGFSGTGGSYFALDAMAVNANGMLATVTHARSQVDRVTYRPAGSGPQAGTVVLGPRPVTLPAVGVGEVAPPIDLGTFTPPYGGDFEIRVRPVGSQVAGALVNLLHVGPHAGARLDANKAFVPPGSPTVSVTATVSGADFTSAARADPRSISPIVGNFTLATAFGADSAGALFIIPYAFDRYVKKYHPKTGATTNYFELPTGSNRQRGAIPVDNVGNIYIAGGSGGKNIYQVRPAADGLTGVAQVIATTDESIWSMVRASSGALFAMGTTRIFRIEEGAPGQPWSVSTLPTGALANPNYLTIDGKDNLYFLASDAVNVFRTDGTRATLVVVTNASGYLTFEREGGSPIAGDCADNVFVTPYTWDGIKPSAEEHMLIHVIGRTGRPGSIFDGSKTQPFLGDMDGMVYDRFSKSLIIQQDIYAGELGTMYRLPVTCGAIDTDLHMVFPAAHPVTGFSVMPKSTLARADGSREYVWSFKDVTTAGKSLVLNATLASMQFGETRSVASEAFITFRNSFGEGDLRVPVAVPKVSADSMVDLGLAVAPAQAQAQTAVTGTVRLTNRDVASPIVGMLLVEVTDAQGARLATIRQSAETIAASSSIEVTAAFDTAVYLTGAYMMKATLTSAGGVELARATATFYIASPSEVLVPSVATDRQAYEASGVVTIFGRTRNVSVNTIASGHVLQVKVRNPAGQEIFSASDAVDLLVPQSLKNSTFSLPLNRAPAGNYEVEAILMKGAAQVGPTQFADFSVFATDTSGTGLAGALLATRVVNVGEAATITATVSNQGNAGVASLDVRIQVVNPATSAVVASFDQAAIALPVGATREITRTWTTTGIAPGTYVATATATVAGRSITLGQDSIRVVADTTPEPFTFAAKTDVPLSRLVVSDPATITGITAPVPMSISGGEYSIDGGATWSAAPRNVENNATVRVRVLSSAVRGTTTSATLTVAGVQAVFSVTTTVEDRTPDAFAFAALTNVLPGATVTSNEVTISGINVRVPISLAPAGAAQYSVNGGAFTEAAGEVGLGDRVVIRLVAQAAFSATATVTLTVSDFSTSFSVTTAAEDRTPDAFALTAQSQVPINTAAVSNEITVTGINTTVPITVTAQAGARDIGYSVNGGAFTSSPGTVKTGDKVAVRQTSSGSFSTKTTVQVAIGTGSAAFDVTTEPEDKTPDPFVLVAQPNVKIDTATTSNEIVVGGINTTVPITVTAQAGARDVGYSVNGGAFTGAPGTVKNGDRVVVRQTSSGGFSTKTTVQLAISTVTANFDVTTEAEDRVPDAFSFTAQANVPLLSVRTSNTITVAGINTRVPVSITGGTYSLNGGAYTAAAGEVRNGDTITVRQTSSNAFAAKTSAVLAISSVSAAFDVTTVTVADVALALGFNDDSRVLVLVSCRGSQGAADPACEQQRRGSLAALLTSLGIEHLLTTDTAAFRTALRSGTFNTYWLTGGFEKLQGTLGEEVREAVFRGESLVVDAAHDDRNNLIDEVLGAKHRGRLSQAASVVLTGAHLPQGSFAFAGDAIKADLAGGTRQAGFDSATGSPAIITNNYGAGRAVFFAFDLVATLAGQPGSNLLKATLTQSIEFSRPAASTAFTGSDYVPFALTITNREPVAVQVEVSATLAGFTLIASSAAPATAGETRWNLTVPANGSLTLEWAYQAPATANTYAGTLAVSHVYGSTKIQVGSSPLSVTVQTVESLLPPAISGLQGLNLTVTAERQARDRAVLSLQQAQTAIGQNQHEAAIGKLIDAVNQLDPITSTSIAQQQAAIDKVLQEVSRRWYLALPACPATPACR